MQVKSDIIQDVINRAKTAVRNFGENAQVELPAELVKNICQNLNAERYRLAKLYKHLMDNAKKYVMAEPVDVYGTLRWYYNENDLLNWIATNLNNGYWLNRHFLKKETEKC